MVRGAACSTQSIVKRIAARADVEVDEPADDTRTKCIMCAREEDKEQLVTCTNCRTSGMAEHALQQHVGMPLNSNVTPEP